MTPPPGARRHDGFYLRMLLGPGFTSAKASSGSESIKLSGGGLGLSVAIGGALRDNFILFGELVVDSAISPDLEIRGVKTGTLQNASANIGGLGGGVAYYFMPFNAYLSGALVASRLTIEDRNNDETGSSDLGPALDLTIGKEWFVSDNWGLGVAVQVLLASMKDNEPLANGATATWKAIGFAIGLSATFN
jgi:hypothetical protein